MKYLKHKIRDFQAKTVLYNKIFYQVLMLLMLLMLNFLHSPLIVQNINFLYSVSHFDEKQNVKYNPLKTYNDNKKSPCFHCF